MTDIIFEYTVPETNWLNPDWVRTEGKKLIDTRNEEEIRVVDMLHPYATNSEKAKMMNYSYCHYMDLRRKYSLGREKVMN